MAPSHCTLRMRSLGDAHAGHRSESRALPVRLGNELTTVPCEPPSLDITGEERMLQNIVDEELAKV